MKDNLSLKNDILWLDISEKGYIKKCFNKPAIYIYMRTCSETRYYVGSTINLASRLSSHRSRFNSYINGDLKHACPIFYNSVRKYGWDSFKFGVLEYLDLSSIKSSKEKKYIILEKEQYYLDSIKPSLNVCKIADSPLGVKRNEIFSISLSKSRRGKEQVKPKIKTITFKPIRNETILNLSSRSKGISVKIFDKSYNLIKEFPTLTSAARHLGVSDRTIGKICKTGISYDDHIYKFEVPIERSLIVITNLYDNTTKEYYSLRSAAKDIGVGRWSISKYINTNKPLKNVYLISIK